MKHGLDGLPYFYLLFLLHPGILQGLDSMNSGEVVYIQVQAKGVVGGSVKLECGLTLPDFYIWGYTAPGTENMHAVAYSFLQGTKLQALTKTLGNLSITTDTASLWIDQLPLVAQGLYTYQAFYKNTFQGDTFIYCYVQLFVLVPVSKPYILVSNTSLVEGTPMWMRCVLENGTEPVNYTWEQEDRDGFITKVAESNINQVNITFVNRNHTGRYRCQATNEVNRQYSDHIWLEVLFGPDVPLIDVTPHSVTEQGYSVFEKTTVSLTCQASSNPPSQYTWFYSNSQVHTGQQYNITSILRVNSGLYSCLAQNFILKTYLNSTVTIFVYYLPDGSPTCNIFPINNYTDLALWCLWEGGYPPASLHWSSHLLNPNVKASSPTNITVIQPGARTPHNSTFTCHGSHVVSPTSYICSTTALLPPGTPQCYAYATQKTEYLMLSCSWEEGYPQALLWWAFNNESMEGSSKQSTSTLVLKSSSTYSGKTFVCHAKHPLLTESKICGLRLDPPTGNPICTISPTNNYTDLAFWCSWVGGYPPASVYWTSSLLIPNDTEPSLTNTTLIQSGSRTPHNSTFTCYGSHVVSPVSFSCSITALLPPGEPQCYATAIENNEYLMLSCSWGGGFPQALLWWTSNNGSIQGSSKENTNILTLKARATYHMKVFVCHTKHPLSAASKWCELRMDPPSGNPTCTVFPTNNYTDLALWCSWEGGYPPASLYWSSPLISPNGSDPSLTNATLVQPGSRTPHNSTFTCYGSHVVLPTSYRCNTTVLLPQGDPQCYGNVTQNQYMTFYCAWEGGSPQALLWWASNNGPVLGSPTESTNILVFKTSATYSGKVFVCHAKHPLSPSSKRCELRLDPPSGNPTCTVFPTNNYTDLALWCSWEGGYPPASLYWSSPLISPNGSDPSLTNATLVQPGSRTPHNSTFTCYGSHAFLPASYSCSKTALLPPGDPQCYAYTTQKNEYLTLSCSWEGGFPQALVWWALNNGSVQGSAKENTNVVVLKASATYSSTVFVCHTKHPLSPNRKLCELRLDPPSGNPTCTIFPTNNYTDLALWCSWEGGYPPASLYWSSPLVSPNGVQPSLTNSTMFQSGSRTPHNSTFICYGSHVVLPTSYICSVKTLVPHGDPQCFVSPTRGNIYLILTCSWEGGFPPAVLWWESDGGATLESSKESMNILILKSSAKYGGKAFTCYAKHPLLLGTKQCVLRLEAPVLATQLKVVSVYEGNDVQLSCILKANYPDTEITWFNNQKKQVGDAPSKYLLYREATWANLTVREVDGLQDSGQYWCSANNAIGGVEIPITVIVKRYPIPPNVTISRIKYSNQQRTEVDLEWETQDTGNLTGFIVELLQKKGLLFKENNTLSWVQVVTGLQPHVHYYKLAGLDPTSSYGFRVLAINHRTLGYPSEAKTPEDPSFNAYPTIIGAVVSGMILATVGSILLILYFVRTQNSSSWLHNMLFAVQHSQSMENINYPEDETVNRSQDAGDLAEGSISSHPGPAVVSGSSVCSPSRCQ